MDNTEATDGYSATPGGWGSKVGTLQIVNPATFRTSGYSLEPYRMNNRGDFLGTQIDYNRGSVLDTINRSPVYFGPVDVNEAGLVIGNKVVNGLSRGFNMIVWDGHEHSLGVGGELFGISSAESPQIVGIVNEQQMLWEENEETQELEGTNLNDLISPSVGWNFDLYGSGLNHQSVIAISDNGLIAGRGFHQEFDPSGLPMGSPQGKAFCLCRLRSSRISIVMERSMMMIGIMFPIPAPIASGLMMTTITARLPVTIFPGNPTRQRSL